MKTKKKKSKERQKETYHSLVRMVGWARRSASVVHHGPAHSAAWRHLWSVSRSTTIHRSAHGSTTHRPTTHGQHRGAGAGAHGASGVTLELGRHGSVVEGGRHGRGRAHGSHRTGWSVSVGLSLVLLLLWLLLVSVLVLSVIDSVNPVVLDLVLQCPHTCFDSVDDAELHNWL